MGYDYEIKGKFSKDCREKRLKRAAQAGNWRKKLGE